MSEKSLESEIEKDMEQIESIISTFIKQLQPALIAFRKQDEELGLVKQRHEGNWATLKATLNVHLMKTRAEIEKIRRLSEKIGKESPYIRETADKTAQDCTGMMEDLTELRDRVNEKKLDSQVMFEEEFYGGYGKKRAQFMTDGKELFERLVQRHKDQQKLKATVHTMFKGDLKNL